MEQNQPNNVIPLKPHYALFNPTLRNQIVQGIKHNTERPEEVVNAVEQVTSAYIVSNVRRFAVKVTTNILHKVFGE